MDKYFKYISFVFCLFFAFVVEGKTARIECTYGFGSGDHAGGVTIVTKDNGKTWYKEGGLFTTWGDRNLISGLTYSVSDESDCPSDGSINLKMATQQHKNRPEITEEKYYVGDKPAADSGYQWKDNSEKQLVLDEEALHNGRDWGGSQPVTPMNPSGSGSTTCSSLFEGLADEIRKIFNAVRIVVPILVIVFSVLDFAKAIFGGSDDDVKKAQSKLAKRLVVAFIFFLLPTLMSFAMGIMNVIYNDGNFNCLIIK